MPNGRKYNCITPETRIRIIKAFENGEDWRTVAKLNGVNCKTAYKWLHVDEIQYKKGSRGGDKKKKLNETEIDEMLEWISADPTVTVEFLSMRVRAEFGKNVSITTIGRYLDCRCLTVKKIRMIPMGMNTEENIASRKEFVFKLLEYYRESMSICWIDETNFNLFCTHTMGRSMKGTRAGISITNCRGRNLHLIGAMTEMSIVYYETRRGSFNNEDCKQWLRTVLDSMKSKTIMSNIVIVCDDAPCHTSLKEVMLEEPYIGGRILRLAPYSPMLNPIENVWSVVKSRVKHQLREKFDLLSKGDPNNQVSNNDFRMQILEHIV